MEADPNQTQTAPEPAVLPTLPWPPGCRYGFARGFTWRREDFGGILYHYEGIRPDPRVTFVNHRFLIDVLEVLSAHPAAALDALVEQVVAHFTLGAEERARLVDYFATLIARGALVPV